MIRDLEIVSFASDQPPDLGVLLKASLAEGHRLVRRTLDDWSTGANRFDATREAFLLAKLDGSFVGMCGLNLDLFLDDPMVGRLRHLYVLPEFRRRRIGQRLVETCITQAAERFDRVRLRSFDSDAVRFYESIGFDQVEEEHATHSLSLARR